MFMGIVFRQCCHFGVVKGSFHIITVCYFSSFSIITISNNSTAQSSRARNMRSQATGQVSQTCLEDKTKANGNIITQTVKIHSLQISLEHARCDLQHKISFLCSQSLCKQSSQITFVKQAPCSNLTCWLCAHSFPAQ